MKRAYLAFALSVGALAFSASDSRAWEWWMGTPNSGPQRVGSWYVDASGFGGALYFPRLHGYTVFTAGNALVGEVSTRHVIAAAGGGLRIGHVLREGALPPWLGQQVRIEVEGYFRGGSSREDAALTASTMALSDLNLLGQDVRPAAVTTASAPSTFFMSSRVETTAFQLALRMRSDFTLAPNLVLTPSIGVFGGRSVDDYAITTFVNVSGLAGNFFPTSTDARIRSWRFGGDVGADLTLRTDTGIAFHFGGRIGVNHVRSSLQASDCLNTAAVNFPANSDCATVLPATAFFSSLSATRNVVGYRASGHVGASFNLIYAVATIGGFVSYDDKVPVFETQRLTSALAFNQTGTPAGIQFRSAISLGGYATIRVPFGL